MRTTLTLDPDVAAEIERRRREHGRTLKHEVNDLLRIGLRHADEKRRPRRPFRTRPASMGEALIDDLDDITAVLEHAEGPDFR